MKETQDDQDQNQADSPLAGAPLILLSAGGTGGHVFPASALARSLRARGYRTALATDERGMRFAWAFPETPIHTLKAGTMTVRGAPALARGVLQGVALVRKLRPAVVVGFGGYPCVPAVLGAQISGYPTMIHEQNALLGRANALLARKARRVAWSWNTHARWGRDVVTGNPVRADIAALSEHPYPAFGAGDCLRLLVMGGSLGASVFAKVVPEALAALSRADRVRLDVVQQCRADDLGSVRAAYGSAGVQARCEVFFEDIPEILAHTHLVIARAGASTVAELAAAGRPAIYVPYPHHADQQQKKNAGILVQAGGGWMMEEPVFTPEALRARLEAVLRTPETLHRAAGCARAQGFPNAAESLADLVSELAHARL